MRNDLVEAGVAVGGGRRYLCWAILIVEEIWNWIFTSGKAIVFFNQTQCTWSLSFVGADQEERGLWERDWDVEKSIHEFAIEVILTSDFWSEKC